MEQLDVSVSSTGTDYGSTTLKTRNANNSNPNPNHTQNVASNRDSRDNNSDFDFNTDTDADADNDADSIHEKFFKTRFCRSISTNISVGYQSLPDHDRDQEYNRDRNGDHNKASATTHLFATQQRFAHHQFSRRLGGYTKMATSNVTFGKMSIDAVGNSKSSQLNTTDSARALKMQNLEIFLGVLNQVFIGFVTIYMSWMCLRAGLAGTALHAWLVTIGFSLLMAEAVMCHYSANVLTFKYKRTTKTTLHWLLQVLGGGCGVAGVLIKCIQKGFQLHSVHGKLGFTAFILCLVSMLSGLAALFPMRLKRIIQPLLNKTLHNFLGISTFVIALIAQYYGYQTGFFSRRVEKDFLIMMQCITLLSLVLTCIGPLKAFWLKLRNIKKLYF